MKLSSEELQIIETVLIQKGIKFDDIRIELLDHIASDIEENQELKKLQFNAALKTSLLKWDDSFKPVSSFLTGSNKYPQIVVFSVYKVVKMQLYASTITVIFCVLIFALLNKTIDSGCLINLFKSGIRVIYVISFLWLIIFKFCFFEKKFKTIFSHFVVTRMIFFIIFLGPMLNSNTPTMFKNQIVFLIIGTIFVCHFLFTSYFAYRHLKIQKYYT